MDPTYVIGGKLESANANAKVVSTIEATNGMIYVVDGVLLPYEGKNPPFGPGTESKDDGLASFNKAPGASGEQRYGGLF